VANGEETQKGLQWHCLLPGGLLHTFTTWN